MRLNKYLAHCGMGTRRETEKFIRAGQVKINDVVISLPYTEVNDGDVVLINEKVVTPKQIFRYWVINKSLKTPLQRSETSHKPSVADLLLKQVDTSLNPVYEIPADIFCGLLVLTSDDRLVEHLHSLKHKVKSTYECVLQKPLADEDIVRIKNFVKDTYNELSLTGIGFPLDGDKRIIGLDVQGGTPELWASVFNQSGCPLEKMDCTFFGGITKKDLKRDWSRSLTEKEVIWLKHFSS